MYTYNDLQKIGDNSGKIRFIQNVISEHENSEIYRNGAVSGLFYRGIDPDLEAIKKVVYDRNGNAHADTVSPNHKLTSNIYHLLINQLVSYQLGNGVSFSNTALKKSLGGAEFDYILQQILIYAANDGEAYGLVTDNGILPMCCACKVNGNEPIFAPLRDEDDGTLRA
ncbi:MAG: phage portal protein, partial [Ruminococcus sp.]|nr:phage portal protein [Ruminococcus sp.]